MELSPQNKKSIESSYKLSIINYLYANTYNILPCANPDAMLYYTGKNNIRSTYEAITNIKPTLNQLLYLESSRLTG